MTDQEYLDQRVNDQINWYDRKSAWHKKWFMRMKIAETILALFIPFLTGYITTGTGTMVLKVTIGLIGVAVAALANLITLLKFQENWISYRSISESLRYEQYLYLTQAGPYKDSSALALFAERVEGILSRENSQWIVTTSKKEEESGAAANA